MKKLKIFLLGLCCLSISLSYAQEENSLLWQISGNGLETPSYLYGTIHIMCPDELVLSPKILKALEESDQLVMELDMDDPAFMSEMQRLSVNDGMKNISSLLPVEDLNTLNAYFKKHYQADLTQLGILKPFALMSMMLIKGLDCPQPASFEQSFMTYAKEQAWQIFGLETINDQVAVFEKVAAEEQLDWLVDYAENEDEFKVSLEKMVDAYQEEDIQQLLAGMDDYPEYQVIEEDLLDKRNEKWIAPMIEFATDKSTFFAVGAAHLPSEKGVIELLKAKGYTLTPILD